MPSDFAPRLHPSDVSVPPAPLAAIRSRAARRAKRETFVRRAFAAIVLTLAVGGFSIVQGGRAGVAPAPHPIASSSPAPTFT